MPHNTENKELSFERLYESTCGNWRCAVYSTQFTAPYMTVCSYQGVLSNPMEHTHMYKAETMAADWVRRYKGVA